MLPGFKIDCIPRDTPESSNCVGSVRGVPKKVWRHPGRIPDEEKGT